MADVAAEAEVPAAADARVTELESVIGELRDKLAMLEDREQTPAPPERSLRG